MEEIKKEYPYHSYSVRKTLRTLETSGEGLSEFEARGRLDYVGPNALPSGESFSYLRIFFSQLYSPLVAIILGAAVLSFFLGNLADSIFILIVILINTVLGFIQESKAENAMEKLKKSVVTYSRVFRGGSKRRVLTSSLVPGDVVEVQAGDKVPADGRVIKTSGIKVGEAHLTGESREVEKNVKKVAEETGITGRSNMLFMGSVVEEGKALYVVTGTGSYTELGKISGMVKQVGEVKTPLQRRLFRLSRFLGLAIIIAVFVFGLLGIVWGKGVREIFVTSVALAVSTIPEGLLPAITVVLVLGARRLAKKKALVRKLNANEVMGAVTVICMDKTGTLTQGEMKVSDVIAGYGGLMEEGMCNPECRMKALEIGALVNDAYVENPHEELSSWHIYGRPTDRALLSAALGAGIDRAELEDKLDLQLEIPFSSQLKYAARAYRKPNGKYLVYLLGSPEEVVKRSGYFHSGKSRRKFSRTDRRSLLSLSNRLANQGLRMLASAEKEISAREYVRIGENKVKLLSSLNFVGFIALKDPLRENVKESLETALKAGINTTIVTGDHRGTTLSIMQELGVEVDKKRVIEGNKLARMTDRQLRKAVKDHPVFVRVLPEHKIRVVKAFQDNGGVVAMVGDGVNDAPALKAADVGIAVGSGTEIAREVSDIILLDNSFSVIVKSVEQGRLIFENIRRVIMYLLADDFSEFFLFFIAMLLGFPFPLYPAQVLWINLVEDGFPDIALTTEKDTRGLMEEKPRSLKEPLLTYPHKRFMLYVFFITGLAALFIFYLTWQLFDLEKARTITFALIAFDSLVFAYVVRSIKRSVFHMGVFSNQILNISVIVSLVFLLAGIYIPQFQKLLHTVSLDIYDWAAIILISVVELLVMELMKPRIFGNKKRGSS